MLAGESSAMTALPPFVASSTRGGQIQDKCGTCRQLPTPPPAELCPCLPGSFDQGMTPQATARQGANVGPMPPRLLAALSLIGAMALTGANVAFGKAIAVAVPVYIFVLFRFVVASLALAPM